MWKTASETFYLEARAAIIIFLMAMNVIICLLLQGIYIDSYTWIYIVIQEITLNTRVHLYSWSYLFRVMFNPIEKWKSVREEWCMKATFIREATFIQMKRVCRNITWFAIKMCRFSIFAYYKVNAIILKFISNLNTN